MSAELLSVAIEARSPDGGFDLRVSFSAERGITALFGPSGAGKSTTLAAIAGLVRPERGRITLGDEVWFDAERGIDVPVHLRKVGFVFQSLALFPHLSAEKNVAYGIDRKLPRLERFRLARSMLERMKVLHLADRRPSTFSGGEAQRVALARALVTAPKIVLLDEAFSAMDRELRKELNADVKRALNEIGIPAILVTHHRGEARALADRAVLLEAGRVRAAGPIEQILPALPAGGGADKEGT